MPIIARTRAQLLVMFFICRVKPAGGPRDRCGSQSMSFQRGAWPGMIWMEARIKVKAGAGTGVETEVRWARIVVRGGQPD